MSITGHQRRRLVALTALTVLVTVYLWWGQDRAAVKLATFDRIETGMTLAEVGRVLDPTDDLDRLWGSGRNEFFVVKSKGKTLGTVYVRDGNVRLKELAGTKPTTQDQLRRWWFWNIGISPPF